MRHHIVHALVVVWEVLQVLAQRRVRGVHSIEFVLTFGLDGDVKLGKSRQQSRDVLVGLAQFGLIVRVFRLIAMKLAIALNLQAFIL